eukprot:4127827-Pleurochrysis_carterae.AAC.1
MGSGLRKEAEERGRGTAPGEAEYRRRNQRSRGDDKEQENAKRTPPTAAAEAVRERVWAC